MQVARLGGEVNEDPIMLALGFSQDDTYALLLALLYTALAAAVIFTFSPSKET